MEHDNKTVHHTMAERVDCVPCQKTTENVEETPDDGSELDAKSENVDDKHDDASESVITPDIEIDPCFLLNDVLLVVEDRHLHVNKDLLVAASPVFAAWLKKEWQDDKGEDNTTKELLFPGKSYDDMVTFLKCLLPFFPDILTDKTLDTVLPLADEYQAEALITKCGEVIRQRVESVSNTNTYIPPSRIVTYVRWVDQFKLHMVKEYVVRLASYLKSEDLEAVPDYDNVSHILQLEIAKARAKLLGSLFVSNATEGEKKMHQFKIPHSAHYMAEWKQNLLTIVQGGLPVQPKPSFQMSGGNLGATNLFGTSVVSQMSITPEIAVIFACMSICDRFDYSKTFDRCINRLKTLNISKQNFKDLWSRHYPTDSCDERARMERHELQMCKCT